MGHHHHHHEIKGNRLGVAILLNCLITIAQFVGGFLSNSLSLLSDAVHNLSDVLSLLVSYVANKIAKRKPSKSKTFGFKRAEVLAAFINAASLLVISIFLIIEAVERFFDPKTIEAVLVIGLAIAGILVNGFSVLLLKKEAGNTMNMRSAYLHLFSDMLASIAVLVGGVLMNFYQVYWIDPFLTLCIALYLIYVSYDLLKASTGVLLLFTPKSIDITQVVATMLSVEKIKNVHHVHVWQLNDHDIHLEAHVDFKEDLPISEIDSTLNVLERLLFDTYHISHVTIQPEFGKCLSKNIIHQE